MDFVAIDFETANYHMTSACSLGIALVKDNKIIETRGWLIKPYPNEFSPFNIAIHGIRPQDVANAPDFSGVWPEIEPYLNGALVVAHNASFDIGVLKSSLEFYKLPAPEIEILCSVRIARAAFPHLGSHKLNAVCAALSIPLNHHDAVSDAAGSAGIIIEAMRQKKINNLDEATRAFSIVPGYWRGHTYRPCHALVKPHSTFDYDGIDKTLFCEEIKDKSFAFTGKLKAFTRTKALEAVARGGGIPQTTVTQFTDYLVVGLQHAGRLKNRKESASLVKARSFAENGAPLKIISEDEFAAMISDGLYRACFGELAGQ